MPDLFRSPGLYWSVGAIGDSWHGVPVRVPVALVRAAGLARGGSIFLEDPDGRVQTLSGVDLTSSRQFAVGGMVRRTNGITCGFSLHEDSIGSRASEAAVRVYLMLSSYLNHVFGRGVSSVQESASEILNGAVMLVSAVSGLRPVSAQLVTVDGEMVLKMTVRMDGVLEDIDVTIGGG